MTYSTIKKVVAYSMLSVLGLSAANAQTTGSPKLFGGTAQYRTWSIGVNAGVISPVIPFGTNDFSDFTPDFAQGAFIKKQFAPSFAVKADFHRGSLQGKSERNTPIGGVPALNSTYETDLHYAIGLKAVANVATIDFLSRENSVDFYVQGGAGLASYSPLLSQFPTAYESGTKNVREVYFPIGVGANFKLSNIIALNIGYDMNFLDADNLDGTWVNGSANKDKWSYGYAGLEFTLGDKSKPSLEWSNPVALMYDELKDPTLRQEVEALKGRVSTLENTVNQLSADSDGDGVSNKFDKCPNTPAGSVVDGAGCPIVFPTPAAATAAPMGNYPSIQFEFDSSVLKTSSYPTLDQLSADLRGNSATSVWLNGYASAEGTEAYNLRLSEDRANSVKTYLVNSGVDASRLTVKGYGEANPVASNATEEGRIQNRRVEIKK